MTKRGLYYRVGRTEAAPARWFTHPFPNLAEPARKVRHLTARVEPYPDEIELADDEGNAVVRKRPRPRVRLRQPPPADRLKLAMIVDHASLHAIDRYFAQVRREIACLELAIPVATNQGRRWYGYTPYDPRVISKLLNIHRSYYNLIQVGQDGRTRAERLGIARGKVLSGRHLLPLSSAPEVRAAPRPHPLSFTLRIPSSSRRSVRRPLIRFVQTRATAFTQQRTRDMLSKIGASPSSTASMCIFVAVPCANNASIPYTMS